MAKWKPIKNYEGIYEISSKGEIRSLERKVRIKGGSYRIVKSKNIKLINNGLYYVVGLSKNGTTKQHFLHRLLAQTFIPNPNNLKCINHINGNKLDNRLKNLEWCTYTHNNREAFRLGLNKAPKGKDSKMFGKRGKEVNSSKIIYQYDINGNFIKKWFCQRDIQRELGFNEKCISNCAVGRQKTDYGYIWKQELKEEGKNNE